MNGFDCEMTDYGFRWGPLEVERATSHPKFGVFLTLRTDMGREVTVRVSPTGRVMKITPAL